MKLYAGVGSRETPIEICKLMSNYALILADLGYGLSSSVADGADAAFVKGAYLHPRSIKSNNRLYLPWQGFNGYVEDTEAGLLDATKNPNYERAKEIAIEVRGSFEGLGRGGIALHTRNVFQILGDDLNTPVEFVVCYAIPVGKQGKVKGGTNTAVSLALKHNIPVYNLWYPEYYDRVRKIADIFRCLSIKVTNKEEWVEIIKDPLWYTK